MPKVFSDIRNLTKLPLVGPGQEKAFDFILDWVDGKLCLLGLTGSPVVVDFSRTRRLVDGRDLLYRAVGRDSRSVIDATAGFGRDSVHLARFGLRVTMLERCAPVAALLYDGLRRTENSNLRDRMRMIHADSCRILPDLRADVVYLDPMFSRTGKQSALPRRNMLLLRQLAGSDDDINTVLDVVLAKFRRVVVKRPDKAPPLTAGVHHSHSGKTVRYDVYLNESRVAGNVQKT